jgi:hypothetical protein
MRTFNIGIQSLCGILASFALAASAAPNKPWDAKEPNHDDRKAFFAFLQKVMPTTLDKVTCHCCKKSLNACYNDMNDPNAPHRCPHQCGVCYQEGRTALEMKRAGKSDAEVVKAIDAQFKIEHPPMPSPPAPAKAPMTPAR